LCPPQSKDEERHVFGKDVVGLVFDNSFPEVSVTLEVNFSFQNAAVKATFLACVKNRVMSEMTKVRIVVGPSKRFGVRVLVRCFSGIVGKVMSRSADIFKGVAPDDLLNLKREAIRDWKEAFLKEKKWMFCTTLTPTKCENLSQESIFHTSRIF
jgi:hypothetical protein